MIHSFTVTFGVKYLTGMVTSVPPYETFSLINFFLFLQNEQSECLLRPQLFIPTVPV
jgi:hypothetical protein